MKSTQTAIGCLLLFAVCATAGEYILPRTSAYKKMVKQMQPYKPSRFQPPSPDSPLIGTWETRKNSSNKVNLSMHSDGVGVIVAAANRIVFFWEEYTTGIRITFPVPADANPTNLILNIKYDEKEDLVRFGGEDAEGGSNKLYRKGKRYPPYSDRKIYLPALDEDMLIYQPPRVDDEGHYKITKHPKLAFALVSITTLNTNTEINSHVDAYRALLKANISPPGGWGNPRSIITKADLAAVTLGAIGNPDNVDLSDPQACIDNMKTRGCRIESVDECLEFITNKTQQ